MRKLLTAYGAGSFAAIASLIALWMCGNSNLISMVGSSVTIHLSLGLASMTLVWGGLWGLVSCVPGISALSGVRGGLVLGLLPAAALCLYFFPNHGWGWFGLTYGWGTPLVTLIGNVIWGWLTVSLNAQGG